MLNAIGDILSDLASSDNDKDGEDEKQHTVLGKVSKHKKLD